MSKCVLLAGNRWLAVGSEACCQFSHAQHSHAHITACVSHSQTRRPLPLSSCPAAMPPPSCCHIPLPLLTLSHMHIPSAGPHRPRWRGHM